MILKQGLLYNLVMSLSWDPAKANSQNVFKLLLFLSEVTALDMKIHLNKIILLKIQHNDRTRSNLLNAVERF